MARSVVVVVVVVVVVLKRVKDALRVETPVAAGEMACKREVAYLRKLPKWKSYTAHCKSSNMDPANRATARNF